MNQKQEREMINKAIEGYRGPGQTLETAIGAYFVGKRIGWKPMVLIHDKKTLRKYEEILDISFRDELPEIGDRADKSIAWVAVQKVDNFWKAVKGEITGIRSPQMR
jgi:hypothetical protein